MRHPLCYTILLALSFQPLLAQAPRPTAPPLILIKAGRVIDGRADAPLVGAGILI